MRFAPARACALLLSTLLAAAAPAVFSQSDADEADWYRVEVLILANRDPDAALSERWPLLPDLEYPDRWLMLGESPVSESGDREFTLITVEDSAPGPAFDLFWDRSVEELLREYRNKQLLREPMVELESLVDLEVPRERVALPSEERELNSQRRRIQNSAGLEVLFHKAWVQRIASKEDALPLIIDGPVQFGDYPELQGSILLYSGRYLHIASDLWLNTGGNYLDDGAVSAGWRMPRPPLPVLPEQAADAPVAMTPFKLDVPQDWLAIEGEPFSTEESAEGITEDTPGATPIPDEAGLMAAPDPDGESVEMVAELEVAEVEVDELPEPLDSEFDETPGHEPVSDAALQAFLEEPVQDYEFRHAVRLQQSRRMRSGELHYIDHPLVGIVVKISRLEFEPFVAGEDDSLASLR